MKLDHGEPPEEDYDLEHPRCVFQILKRHFAPYTPEVVEQVCGVPREKLIQVAETLCRNSGRERTSAICYAVGWTQHTHGVQNIRAASIIQLLLGNIGRPGGGILALRGHANIQGSTDIPTLYDILPGYIPMPHPNSRGQPRGIHRQKRSRHRRLGIAQELLRELDEGVVGGGRKRGQRLRARLPAAHQRRPLALPDDAAHDRRRDERLHRDRPEPRRGLGQRRAAAESARKPRLARRARHERDRDRRLLVRLEGNRDGRLPPRGHRHRGVLHARRRPHREGRHLHQHAAAAAVALQGGRAAGGLPLGPVVHLPARSARAAAARRLDRPERPPDPGAHLGLPDAGAAGRARRRDDPAGDQRAQGRRLLRRRSTRNSKTTGRRPAARGSTPASTRTGSTTPPARSRTPSRTGSPASGAGPGPATAASSTTAPRPTRRANPGRSASATCGGTPRRRNGRASATKRTSSPTRRRTTARRKGRRGWTRSTAMRRSSCTRTGSAGCTRRRASSTVRCRPTTSRTSRRSRT